MTRSPVADEIRRSIPDSGLSDPYRDGMEMAARIAEAFERAALPPETEDVSGRRLGFKAEKVALTPEFCGLGPAPVAWNPPVVGTITGGSTPHAWNPPVVGTITTASSLTSLALPASSAGTDATCPECDGEGERVGEAYWMRCTACDGTGRAPEKDG